MIWDLVKRCFGFGRLPVLCCCAPDNLEGWMPASAQVPTRIYVQGWRLGLAFAGHDLPFGRKFQAATPEERARSKSKNWLTGGSKRKRPKKKPKRRKGR